MPPPPPPLPPPVPANFVNQRPKMTENRTHLLNEIHHGARLKKTITNDRSAPLIGGKTGDKSSAVPKAATINESLGALFSTGIPRKPSDIKSQKSSSSISTSQPASENRTTMAKIKFVDEKDNLPFSVKSSNIAPSLADLKNRKELQTVSSAPSLPPPLPAKVLKQNSAAGQFDIQICRVPNYQNAQFQTLRPAKAPPVSLNSGGLRRSESSEELKKRTTNISSAIKRPGAPPPPPPSTKLNNPPPLPHVTHIQYQSQNTGYNHKPSLMTEAPRPPPRVSSCQESLEQRFHFVPISELPPPPRFIGFVKDYGITGKRHQQLT
ncbi:hypothetical protein ACQ4LE_003102 [Meloidogyne hapla]|uniref:WH2 domain-containing protein n=1 Tax=Meloidogyne hapla TaxID=6305 RepID=A0A1I8BR81_MELHA